MLVKETLDSFFDFKRKHENATGKEGNKATRELPLQFVSKKCNSCADAATDWALDNGGRGRSVERCLNSYIVRINLKLHLYSITVFKRINDLPELLVGFVVGGVTVECVA